MTKTSHLLSQGNTFLYPTNIHLKSQPLRENLLARILNTFMRHFLVFGSHPKLSLAEFRAVFPHIQADIIESIAVIDEVDWNGYTVNERLGGTVKLGDIVLEVPREDLTAEAIIAALPPNEETSKLVFGLTLYGEPKGSRLRRTLPMELKRAFQQSGRSVRWFRDETGDISSAAITKLHLTSEGYDLVVGISGKTAFVGRTTHVQDADVWSERDFGRPARDAKNGMLPPKLARMLVNLAGPIVEGRVLYDPFCGSGTVLTEALLLGYSHVIGSDIDQKQLTDSTKNLAWMKEQNLLSEKQVASTTLFCADVRQAQTHLKPNSVDVVVTEGYLGAPLRGHETQPFLDHQCREIQKLWAETLRTIHSILRPNGIVVGVWPAFRTDHGEGRVNLRKELSALGYDWVDPFDTPDPSPLQYHRAGQWVIRTIFIAKKK